MSTLNKNTIDVALKEINALYPLSKEASKILKVYDKLPEDEKEYSTVDFLNRHAVSEINKKHNNGEPFVADWSDGSYKYELWWVWFRKPNKSDKKADILFNRDGVGFVVAGSHTFWSDSSTAVGSRLLFVSETARDEFRNNKKLLQLYALNRV